MEREEIVKFIKGLVMDEGNIEGECVLSNNFDAYNINSLAFMRMIVQLEYKYEIEFTDDDLISENYFTINGLIEKVLELI